LTPRCLVIRSPRLAVVEHRGKDIVKQLFTAVVQSDGDLLPTQWKRENIELP
jgi:dGTPase